MEHINQYENYLRKQLFSTDLFFYQLQAGVDFQSEARTGFGLEIVMGFCRYSEIKRNEVQRIM